MTDAPSDAAPDLGPGVDPDDLATTLRVLAELHQIDNEHPDFVAVRHATAAMFKAVKRVRRKEIRDAIAEADKAVSPAPPPERPTASTTRPAATTSPRA